MLENPSLVDGASIPERTPAPCGNLVSQDNHHPPGGQIGTGVAPVSVIAFSGIVLARSMAAKITPLKRKLLSSDANFAPKYGRRDTPTGT